MKFSEIDRVVTFCKAGWEAAKAHGVQQTAILRTAAPVFHSFSDAQVEPFVFDNSNPDSPHKFGAELQDTCQQIGKALRAVPALADCVPTVIAAITRQQYLLRFANALSQEDLNKPTLLIMPVLPNGLPADPFLHQLEPLFDAHPACHRLVVEINRERAAGLPPVPKVNLAMRVESLRDRIGFAPLRTLALPLILKLEPLLPRSTRGRVGLLTDDNPLIRETAMALTRRGYRVRRLPSLVASTEPCTVDRHVHAVAEPHLSQFISNWAPHSLQAPILKAFLNAIDTEMGRYVAALPFWRNFFDDSVEPWVGVLANLAKNPQQWALFQACKERDLFFATFQHGLSREICMYPRYSSSTHEMTASTHFFSYNKVCADIAQNATAAQGEAFPIGPPQEITKAGHHRRPTGKLPSIFYVSTNLYSMLTSGIRGKDSDLDMARSEHDIITNILAKLQHRVLYKPYPHAEGRFLDPDPCLVAAQAAVNIEVHKDHKDLSLLLPDARLIITARATSTLGWCMATRRPIVFIDMPYSCPLLPELRESVANGVFLFDSSDSTFRTELLRFLAQPLSVIEGKHAATKTEGRERLLEKYYMGMRDGAGIQAAAELEKTTQAYVSQSTQCLKTNL